MSYNYEINLNNTKKKSEQSKYTYKTNESDSPTLIFELVLKDKNNENIIIRRIKKSNQGVLITPEDNIKYNMMERYRLTIIDVNSPDNVIYVKDNINHTLSTNTFMNNMIYLEITEISDCMNICYNLL
jgi:hypothetical protein